jgi:uncharacterized membrane protein YcfT
MPIGVARPESEARVPWVDYAKGFCIIMVVMMHSTLGTGNEMGGQGFLHRVVAFALPFRMPDFFVIAGLFLSQTINRDWRTFIDRKVIHFSYFYLLWLAIQVLVKYARPSAGSLLETIDQFGFGLVEPLGTLWFIYLLPIFFVVTRLVKPLPPIVVWIAAALLETARISTPSTVINEFAQRYVYFYSGYLLSSYFFTLAAWVRANRKTATAALALWAGFEIFMTSAPTPFVHYPTYASLPIVSLIAGFIGAGAVITAGSLLCDIPFTKWLRYCGRNSIVIYLAFFLPMAATRTLIVHYHLTSNIGLASVIVTFMGVSIPLLMHALVRNTRLKFLFERPAMFWLVPAKPKIVAPVPQPAVGG